MNDLSNRKQFAAELSAPRETQAKSNRTAVLVLGMHRTGSSALTRFLSFLGCTMPQTLMQANAFNPVGYWESDAVREVNDAFLQEAGSSWDDWQPVHADWFRSCTYFHNVQTARQTLRSEFGDAALFALKDPRICRLAGLWYEALAEENIDVVTLTPVRHPLEVAASLHKRDGMHQLVGQLLWLRHVLDAELASRGRRRFFSHYEDLLSDWGNLADRMATGLDIVWPRSRSVFAADAAGFLSSDFRTHNYASASHEASAGILPWVRDTYAILCRWTQNGEDESDRDALDDIRSALTMTGDSLASYVHALSETSSLANRLSGEVATHEASARDHGIALELAESQITQLHDAVEEGHSRNQALQIQSDEMQRTMQSLESDLAAARENSSMLQDELYQAREQNAQHEEIQTAVCESIAHLQDQLVQAREQNARHEEIHAATGENIAQLQDELSQVREQKARLYEMQGSAAKTISRLEATLQMAIEETATTRAVADEKERISRFDFEEMQRQMTALETELAAARDERATMQEELARLTHEKVRQDEAQAHAEKTIARLEQALAAANLSAVKASEDAAALASTLTAKIEHAEAQSARSLSRENEVARRLAQTEQDLDRHKALIADMENIKRQLRGSGEQLQQQIEKVAFLRNVLSVVVAPQKGLGQLTPEFLRRMRTDTALRELAIFDSQSYLNRYEDVANSGSNPLIHYLSHGMEEGRKPI